MLYEVQGDILLSEAQAIAHGVAPNDHFDSGLALALREKWPAMAKDFRHFAHQTHPKPGDVWMWGRSGWSSHIQSDDPRGRDHSRFATGQSDLGKRSPRIEEAPSSNRKRGH